MEDIRTRGWVGTAEGAGVVVVGVVGLLVLGGEGHVVADPCLLNVR